MESRKPKKQRKMLYNLPLHRKAKQLSVHLGKELRKQLKKRAVALRAKDTVVVMRGKHRKARGKVSKVDHKRMRVFIEGVVRKKSDGTEILVPVHASNLLLVELAEREKKAKPAAAAAGKKQAVAEGRKEAAAKKEAKEKK